MQLKSDLYGVLTESPRCKDGCQLNMHSFANTADVSMFFSSVSH